MRPRPRPPCRCACLQSGSVAAELECYRLDARSRFRVSRSVKLASFLVGVAVIVAAGSARAQSLRPNILVVFDTSGSMLHNDTDDGTSLCAGNGTSCRIFSLKKALRDALAQVGT